MSNKAIRGENVVLEVLVDAEYTPIACVTSLEFSIDTELIERKGTGLLGARGFKAGEYDWSITLNSVTSIAPPGDQLSVFYVLTESVRKNGLDIRLIYDDNSGNLKVLTGHVLIPRTGIASPVDGFSEDTIELKGDGSFAISTTLVNPGSTDHEVIPYDYTSLSGGETQLTVTDLIDRTLLYVGRDGIDKEVITVGTPDDKQVKYDEATGTVYFAFPLSADEWVHILYK